MADTIPVIWGQTSDGQDAYVHSCTKAVYNPETGKTLDEEMVTMQDSPAAITGETPIKPVCDASGNVICPQTRTAAVYDLKSGQTLDKFLPKSLWENPMPDSTFTPQTISLDISAYTHVLVIGRQNSGNRFAASVLVPVGMDSCLSVVWQSSGKFWSAQRAVITESSGIQFGEGAIVTDTVTSNNGAMVPQKIYGIKM